MNRSRVLAAVSLGLGLMNLDELAIAQVPSAIAQAKPPYNCLTREVWTAEKELGAIATVRKQSQPWCRPKLARLTLGIIA